MLCHNAFLLRLFDYKLLSVLHIDALLRLSYDTTTREVVDWTIILNDHSLGEADARCIVIIAEAQESACK